MPNIKFTSLSADGELLADDKIPFVDISDNAMGETGTNKIISASSLSNSVATLMSVNRLNGAKIVDSSLSSVKLSTGGPVWDASGNFSIGTSSSSSTLITSIGKNRTSPGTSELHLFSTVSNTANATIVRGDSDNGDLSVSNTGTGNVVLSQTGSGALIFSTAGSERVRIVPEGRVGIGKSNPATALDVVGTITAGSYSGDATLSGTPTAPTATAGTNTTRIATTEFVQTAISDSVKTSGAQTIAGIKTFSSTIVGSITGNSGTTDALKTAISAALTGDVTGTASNITGSSNISIPTAIGAGVIDNSKVSTNAAIAGTKISPNFGSQNIVTTGTLSTGAATLGTTFLSRQNTSGEGGELQFSRSNDGAAAYIIDVLGTTNSPVLRLLTAPTVNGTANWLTPVAIKGNGNVGIGASDPAAPLTVVASATDNSPNNNGIRVVNTGTAADDNAYLAVHTTGANGGDPVVSWDIAGVAGWSAGIDNSDSDKFKIAANWNDLASNNTVTIDRNGNVGIGTTNPVAYSNYTTQTIYGTNGGVLSLGSSNENRGELAYTPNRVELKSVDAKPLFLGTSNLDRITILSGGNVGIGKTNPSTVLDVNGTVTATAFSGPLTGNVTGIASGNVKQGGGTNQTSNVVYMGWSASNQLRVQVDSTDFGVNWPINVSGNANTSSSCSGNSATATLATKASTLAQGGGNGAAMTFNWVEGNPVTPAWLWGGWNGTDMYVYSPSKLNVAYADRADNVYRADQLQAYTSDDYNANNGHHYIKAIREDDWGTRLKTSYYRGGSTTNDVRVGYADSASITTTALGDRGIPGNTSSYTYTGIPDWAKKITILFHNVSISNSSQLITVRVHTASGQYNTGYVSTARAEGVGAWDNSNCWVIASNAASYALYGRMTLSRFNSATWIQDHTLSLNPDKVSYGTGAINNLNGPITAITIASGSGSLFDSGSFSVLVE